ncbi:uncharacterized protein si:dkey-30e9.6 isoform X2 [Scyliorhinus canicula]|uniref:uncharacterized protein si:dkey-30e9.6 isoform X2 n=1 Tax=Scyliorhinus canicula TaxID=7830 RepID=UPI0018F631BC|nr:uncharacterized protein si:dkey-30e9.6 isoform X2 [Scyliorhinus canicula]
MDPKIALFSEPSFGFLQKINFTARQSLAVTRSKSYVHPKPQPLHDVWNRKPPDFSPQFYTSSAIFNEKVTRKKRNTSKDYKKVETSGKVLFPEVVLKKNTSNFVCRFKILDPFEAKIMFVKNGKYAAGAFKDLKPHDFRQYDTNIPGFVTSFDRDPFNLKLKSKDLNRAHELLPDAKQLKGTHSQSIETHKAEELKWDSQLSMRKETWPQKSASYTRHRRNRGAHSAFMDRVEEKVTKLWQNEQQMRHSQPMDINDSARIKIAQ